MKEAKQSITNNQAKRWTRKQVKLDQKRVQGEDAERTVGNTGIKENKKLFKNPS